MCGIGWGEPPPEITLGGACVLSVLKCIITVYMCATREREERSGWRQPDRKGVREENGQTGRQTHIHTYVLKDRQVNIHTHSHIQ